MGFPLQAALLRCEPELQPSWTATQQALVQRLSERLVETWGPRSSAE